MVHHEKVNSNRIHVVPLSYNFDLYQPIIQENVEAILKKYSSDILLLSVFRLTKYKRPFLSISLVKELIRDGIDAKLIILGQGELASKLKNHVASEGLDNSVFFEGYVNNVQEYMTAADILVHPSLLDSSSIVLKESGIVKLPIIACHDVGDFDEVIDDKVNGFLVDKDNFVAEAKSIIDQYLNHRVSLKNVGKASELNVRSRFSIFDAKAYYERCFHN
jgi:glycosyltransferase involved in cell wall biosynthesis